MRVLIVSRSSYPLPASQGGTDAYALRTATYLVPQGHQVVLIGQGVPGPAFGAVTFVRTPTNVPVTSRFRTAYFLKGFLLNVASVLTAIRYLARHSDEVDVIHCNSNLGVLALKPLFPGKPLVYTLHDPLYTPGAARTFLERLIRPFNNGLLEHAALRRADHIIAVSSEIRAQAERAIGPEKLTLLYPLSRASTTSRERPVLAEGMAPSGPYVLSVGAQTGRKRFDLLIRALAGTRDAVGLVLVGMGSERARLVRATQDAGVQDRVRFYDHVSEGELSGLYRGALVYAMASEREGFPATLMEAALSGTPTLYFTDAPAPDLEAFQSDFFRVVHSLEEPQIADAINWVWTSTEDGSVDRNRIAVWARSRFPTPESVAREIGRIYTEVAETA